MRIVVLGYMVRFPSGGMIWHHLHYVVGLHRLGHEVLFVEDSEDYDSCFHASDGRLDRDPAEGIAFVSKVFEQVGLAGRLAYFDQFTNRWHGPAASATPGFLQHADLLLNVSCINPLRGHTRGVPVRALIDTDPLFVQIRHLQWPEALQRAREHNAFFSFGENVGRPDCDIPDDGLPWKPTRQPICLEGWPVATPASPPASYTTVMQWNAYKVVTHLGRTFGMKSQSFEAFESVPSRVGPKFELAIGGPPPIPRDRLRAAGWTLRDSREVTRDPWVYQDYLRGSRGEFTVAKHGYVAARTGWFSERSANYLALGRPVITQDTGLANLYPCGKGLLAFSSMDEAVAALEAVEHDYEAHCAAARALAESHFDSSRVLQRLLNELR